MAGEFGHWDVLCDIPSSWAAFVYLMIDTSGKKYIGAKTKTKKWQTYTSSSKYVKDAIKSGIEFEYFILEFYDTKEDAFIAEDIRITRDDAVYSDQYYNRSRAGKEFNRAGCKWTSEQREHMRNIQKGAPGHKHTEEHKEYMRQLMSGRVITDESIEKMKQTKAENPFVYTDELRNKMSQERRGKVKDTAHRLAIKAANPKGQPIPRIRTYEDGQAKPGRAGENHHQFKGWWVCDGIEYSSITEAAKVYGLAKKSIRHRCNTKMLPGWYFKPKGDASI